MACSIGEEDGVVVAGLRTVVVVVQQEAHRVVVLVSRSGLGSSSS